MVTEYIAPKYEEFVEPHVKTHLVPAYKQYLSPHVAKVKTLWAENGAPLLLQAITETEKLYSTHLAGHVNKIAESAGPVWQQVRRDGGAMIQSVRESNKDLFSGWEKKSESILEDFRAYVAIAGIECRRLIDLGSQKGSEWFVLAKETGSDWLVKAQDMAANGSSDGMDKAKVFLSEAALKAQNGIQIGLSEANKLLILTIQKTSVYYQQFLDATGEFTDSKVSSYNWCLSRVHFRASVKRYAITLARKWTFDGPQLDSFIYHQMPVRNVHVFL